MLPDEVRKLSEVPFFLQNLAAQFRFGHLSIEMRRNRPLESPAFQIKQ